MSQTRRVLVASILALAASPAIAAGKKSVEVGKAFPFLENYLKLPAGERSRFTVAYYLKRDGRPAVGLKGSIIMGDTRTPLTVQANGKVSPLPTLAQLRGGAKVEFDVPEGTRMSISLSVEATMRPAIEMSAAELALAVAQAAKGAKKAAGLLGVGMPTLASVMFKGVSAGTVVHADGHTTALPLKDGSPLFQPAKLRTAATLKFARAPSQLLLAPAEG